MRLLIRKDGLTEYEVEPDVSAACYFYAMVPLLKTSVIVKGVQEKSLQGDIQFLNVLEQMGCQKEKTPEGIRLTMKEPEMHGVDISMKDFSDQTMTLAAFSGIGPDPCDFDRIAANGSSVRRGSGD